MNGSIRVKALMRTTHKVEEALHEEKIYHEKYNFNENNKSVIIRQVSETVQTI